MTRHVSRREDWPEQLDALLEERRTWPFEWGRHDCVVMAADWIEIAVGDDPIDDLRGAWSDARQALEQIDNLQEQVDQRLPNRIVPALAQRGDIVLHRCADRPGLGICVGERFAAPLEGAGIALIPMNEALAAWRI